MEVCGSYAPVLNFSNINTDDQATILKGNWTLGVKIGQVC